MAVVPSGVMDPKDLANNMLPSFVEILLGAPIYMLAKRYRIKEPTAAFLIGVVGAAICLTTIVISGKPNALKIIIQLSVATVALVLWFHVLYATWKDAQKSTAPKRQKTATPSIQPSRISASNSAGFDKPPGNSAVEKASPPSSSLSEHPPHWAEPVFRRGRLMTCSQCQFGFYVQPIPASLSSMASTVCPKCGNAMPMPTLIGI